MVSKIELLKSFLLPDFPSGSSINYTEEKFYLIGDDATHVLVLDINYQKIELLELFAYAEKRIPKADKIDLEGSVILEINDEKHLLVMGSASRKNRKTIIIIPLVNHLSNKSQQHSIFKTEDFIKRIKLNGPEEINLEGICIFQNNLLLANRGNRASAQNHLIVTDKDFWLRQDEARLFVVKLLLPHNDDYKTLGVSELCYVESHNILLLTLTSEATDNAYDDGEIGDSFLGWIEHASNKLVAEGILMDGLINLGDIDPVFKNEKIEGICVESVKETELILHLVSDNDSGESRLFKIKMLLDK